MELVLPTPKHVRQAILSIVIPKMIANFVLVVSESLQTFLIAVSLSLAFNSIFLIDENAPTCIVAGCPPCDDGSLPFQDGAICCQCETKIEVNKNKHEIVISFK
jgi:hypothetical protein